MTPAPTMPGSLFPRSASLMPETVPRKHQRAVPRLRTPTPPPPPIEPIVEEAEPETAQSEHEESSRRGRTLKTRTDQTRDRSAEVAAPSPVRESSRHSNASGRDASSSRRSLDEPVEPVHRPRSSKGKERAWDTSGEVRVRGKERELQEAREEHERHSRDRGDGERDHDKQRIRMLEEEVARLRAELALKNSNSMMPPPPPPPPPPPLFRSQAPSTLSGESGNFLASARAGLKRTEPPVEAPINSVAYGARTKKTGQPTVNVPSDKMAAFLREMKTVRLRRVGGLTGNTSMGPPASTARAAGAGVSELDRSTISTRMSRARMAATLGERSFDLGVAASLETGAKRKRSVVEESSAGPSKRRETNRLAETRPSAPSSQSLPSSSQSSASSANSSFSSSSGRTSSSRTNFFEAAPPRTQPPRPKTNAPLRIWPTASTAETDLTTPSLCSDNENEQSSHDDKLPDTPSDSGRNRTEEKSAAPPERVPKLEPEHEIIDVDALETPARPQPSAANKRDLFARRPPASPLPASAKSPDKPKPPARAAKSKIPLALPRRVPVVDEGSESDDPLAGPPSRPESRARSYAARDDAPRAGPSRVRRDLESSPSPPARSQPRAVGGDAPSEGRMTNHARRRLTLDDELRRAGDTLWQPSDEEDADAAGAQDESEPDVDSGELVAMGTRSSKRGFLARGGGAGAPVFMGEGYVQGASAAEWLATRAERSRSGTGESGSRKRR
ncbi:uncharacterized protein TRAVEDRAFT_59336 [Trametes versicolor FP-101664 SS1]|uniref:uncharacterized protein n=1 Tax=Trametes versicolor (strain FP-101664) TaxID=717944 RepID=UPI00046245FD|nr:uncharacterized protein TRAVEDRAFT_59336 [Trametes versicolor FP-101664 SS1]EIW57775.1 hypothetical protein TRAVEDRAFT_59336 [Trametes versicolor FP-101664 SS1]